MTQARELHHEPVVNDAPASPGSPAAIEGRRHYNDFMRRLSGLRSTRVGALVVADVLGMTLPVAWSSGVRYWLVALCALNVFMFQSAGLYRARLHLSILDELPTIASRMIAGTLILSIALAALSGGEPTSDFWQFAFASFVCEVLCRAIILRVVVSSRRRGAVRHPTLILGSGVIGSQLFTTLDENAAYGLLPVGFVDDHPFVPETNDGSRPHLGTVSELSELLIKHKIHVLVVAFSAAPSAELIDAVRRTEASGVEVFVVPRLFELQAGESSADHIGGVPVLRLRRTRLNSTTWLIKRAFDIFVSFVALVLLAPLMLTIALLVRLEGGKGVLFRQERIGINGQPFSMLKFRSMKPVDESESQTNWNIANDKRVGKVGKFLRRSSLDELPQLLNILKGEMSIVGPRPERPFFVDQFSGEHLRYSDRHRVPVGLTGLAQISGLRGDTSIATRARYDNYYIENWSLWLDVKIIAGTVSEVLHGGGR